MSSDANDSSRIQIKNLANSVASLTKRFGSKAKGLQYRLAISRTTKSLAVKGIAPILQSTDRPGQTYCHHIGRYIRLHPNGEPQFRDPILIVGTDGVGTKLKIAQDIGINHTVGIDLVAMCVNDTLCNGAEPLTFLDYYACGTIDATNLESVVAGIAEGCKQSCSSLVSGKTSELPQIYEAHEYDLAGFALGIAENGTLLPRVGELADGDCVIALPSSGVHSNGFSLVHKVMALAGVKLSDVAPFSASGKTFGEELLTPTKIYTDAIAPLLKSNRIKAVAHITGGGLIENIPRVLPDHLAVHLSADEMQIPPVFGWLAAKGNIKNHELQRTFNCGTGLILVVAQQHVDPVLLALKHQHGACLLGSVRTRKPNEAQVFIDDESFSKRLQTIQRNLSLPRRRVGVLISGTGGNLQALIDATRNSAFGVNADIVFVLSNKDGVLGLKRAATARIPCKVISHLQFKESASPRQEFDRAVTRELEAHHVDWICLAGFMRILSSEFVQRWSGRLINIHPSILPNYPGLHAQKQALEASPRHSHSGCTVHFVDEGVDTGKIIWQEKVPIHADDTEDTLTDRIHVAEHYAYPRALRILANAVGSL